MVITLQKARMEDCDQIHEMQINAFQYLLNKYKDYDTNPGAEPLENVKQRMAQSFTDYYIILLSEKSIGAIRIIRLQDYSYRISPIFILPEYQCNGYAQQAIKIAESFYPQSIRWELDTIKQEEKLCYLYEKMGYSKTDKEENIKAGMTIITYEKLL